MSCCVSASFECCCQDQTPSCLLSMLCRVCAGLPLRFAETEVRVPETEQMVQIVVEAITGDAFIINSATLRLVEDPNESGCLEPGQGAFQSDS